MPGNQAIAVKTEVDFDNLDDLEEEVNDLDFDDCYF